MVRSKNNRHYYPIQNTNSKPKTTYNCKLLVGASRSNSLKNKEKFDIIKTKTEEERIPAEHNYHIDNVVLHSLNKEKRGYKI